MMHLHSQIRPMLGKALPLISTLILCVCTLSACSTNPATGKSQFAGLMSPAQEVKVGAEEHQKILEQYGLYKNPQIQAYVSAIGNRVTQKTERPDVKYKFFVLDSPIVNAFALPGGYIYVTRGLLALANSEAELAGVLSHETGHITARHSAERYSHSVVTSVGATILSVVLDNSLASQALGTGANLYLSGYSRGQENEADALGLRYMTQGGYQPEGLTSFLVSLNAEKELAARIEGREIQSSYLSTHPPTPERIQKTASAVQNYAIPQAVEGRDSYFNTINGITYGDSAEQGFTKGETFYHPGLGFAFSVPKGYEIINQPTQVIAKSNTSNAIMLFDFGKGQSLGPDTYIAQEWMNKQRLSNVENITVNGLRAATSSFAGTVNNTESNIRVIAISQGQGKFARFQIAIPAGVSSSEIEALKSASYSFRTLSEQEKKGLKPHHIQIITASPQDTVQSLARRMPYTTYQQERFRLLNGLTPSDKITAGRKYKIIKG